MDKWILTSCMQKSIRRGHADLAMMYAEKLMEIERSYFFYRISIIAAEDVGLGNIPLMNEIIETGLKKEFISQWDNEKALDYVKRLALSDKDRSLCDLGHIASYSRPQENFQETSLDGYLKHNHLNMDYLTQLSIHYWSHLKHRGINHRQIKSVQNDEFWKNLNIEEKLLKDILETAKFQKEPIFYNMAILLPILEHEKSLNATNTGKTPAGKIIERDFSNPTMIGDYLMEGVDKHTSIGKRSLGRLLETNKAIKEALSVLPEQDRLEYLGYVQFRCDAEQVNKRLYYPTAVLIYKETRMHEEDLYKKLSSVYLENKTSLKKILESEIGYRKSLKV